MVLIGFERREVNLLIFLILSDVIFERRLLKSFGVRVKILVVIKSMCFLFFLFIDDSFSFMVYWLG